MMPACCRVRDVLWAPPVLSFDYPAAAVTCVAALPFLGCYVDASTDVVLLKSAISVVGRF